ncbi:MAG: glycosyltransferase family 2 protein [Flavobacteriales bacterium]|nr:glycosyltransferase family 2 protein [Flavobacteriales bacterium]
MISVVIPCLNESKYIDDTLSSLQSQVDLHEPFEVIVVDGGSDDGTRDILNRWSRDDERFRWIDNPKRTTPVAMNLGIESAFGEIIIILGAHAEVSNDWIMRNVEALKAHPESGCVGGVVKQVHGSEQSKRIGAALSTPFGVGDARFRTGGTAAHVDTVAFGAYRKEALDEIGWFDEALDRNQDDELNYRMLKSGWRIWFDPRIQSSYHVRSSFTQLFRQYRQYGYWKVKVNQKHKAITTWRQTIPALFLAAMTLSAAFWVLDLLGVWSEAWKGMGESLLLSGASLWLVVGTGSAISASSQARDITGILRAYLVVHCCYGLGYWEGIFRFLILKRAPGRHARKLTR